MINTVLNEGVKGMLNSQKEMMKAAHDIANLNVRGQEEISAGNNEEDQALLPVDEAGETARVGNIAEPIVELRRQELVFTANAKVVATAADTLGSLLDVKS